MKDKKLPSTKGDWNMESFIQTFDKEGVKENKVYIEKFY